jgi:hypothetical protein
MVNLVCQEAGGNWLSYKGQKPLRSPRQVWFVVNTASNYSFISKKTDKALTGSNKHDYQRVHIQVFDIVKFNDNLWQFRIQISVLSIVAFHRRISIFRMQMCLG